jgi:hypothetical protein
MRVTWGNPYGARLPNGKLQWFTDYNKAREAEAAGLKTRLL